MREEDGSRSSGGCDETRDKLQSSGGAFVPFKRQSGQIVKEKIDNLLKEKNKTIPVNNLSLRVPMVEIGSIDRNSKGTLEEQVGLIQHYQSGNEGGAGRLSYTGDLSMHFNNLEVLMVKFLFCSCI